MSVIPPEDLNDQALAPIVRAVLGDNAASIVGWQCEPLNYAVMAPASGGIFRVAGSAALGGKTVPWSMVLKMVLSPVQAKQTPQATVLSRQGRSMASLEDQTSSTYWRREALAYQSDLFAGLPEGFAAPQCFGVTEFKGGNLGIWLEEVQDDAYPKPWPLERFYANARHLGRFNGLYLTERSRPRLPWLATNRVERMFDTNGPVMRQVQAANGWRHPLVREFADLSLIPRVLAVWNQRDRLLGLLNRLPATLCHGDTNCANLLTRRGLKGEPETVAVDWQWLGIEALGSDLTQLICGTLRRFEVDMKQASALVQTVFAGYDKGLAESGFHGEDAALLMAWVPGATAMHVAGTAQLLATLDEERIAWEENLWQKPIRTIVEHRVNYLTFLLSHAEAALRE